MNSQEFSQEWQEAWNSHDLERILRHYRNDIVFRSRKAHDLMGSGEIHGKDALRQYWAQALIRQPDLEFQIEEVFEGHDAIVICYINHKGVRAAETLYFDEAGQVFLASACHLDR